jgi:TolB-like protein
MIRSHGSRQNGQLAFRIGVGVLVVLALSGCAISDPQHAGASSVMAGSSPYQSGDSDERSNLGSLTYRAVDLILAGAPDLRSDTPLIVASLADTQNMETSSALGNIVADMIRSRIVQDGYTASEFRLRNEVSFSKGEGEFMLSRNRRALMGAPNAAAIVTGTYAASYEKVYVSIKLVSATDAHIIAGADFVVPLKDVSGLIRHGTT